MADRTSASLLAFAALVAGLIFLPVLYLLLRAFESEPDELASLVFRVRNLKLLFNTVLLAASVVIVSQCVALPRISGFCGALLILSIANFPYLFLNLRAAFLRLDPELEEEARTLGASRSSVFWRVVYPQLRPALSSGRLLIVLHVFADFGVVSLLRYETFSYAIYTQYVSALDRHYAACLALLLLLVASLVVFFELRFLRELYLSRVGKSLRGDAPRCSLGLARWPCRVLVTALVLISVLIPLGTLFFWLGKGVEPMIREKLWGALGHSIEASVPAALLAAVVSMPIAGLIVRYPSRPARIIESVAYYGYATPPLAFALGFVFVSLKICKPLYQTLTLLILAYTLHFLAEAIGPIKSAFYKARPRLEEAARTLGRSPLGAFFRAQFPVIFAGSLVSVAFVFLSAMKELPIAFILSPHGFHTLATTVCGYIDEAMFQEAAPFALVLVAASSGLVGLLLYTESRSR